MVYQQNINPYTKLAVWHITEQEPFFAGEVPLQRNITHPHKRLQHLAGRFLLKELFPGFPYDLIKIADARKPFLADEAYHFSISHCGDYAAAIISPFYRVGVDIEMITDKVLKVEHKFVSPHEQTILRDAAHHTGHPYITMLVTAWSIKESLFKWYGGGEVDFIGHLHIEQVHISDNNGFAQCRIDKEEDTMLQVHFLHFNNNCLSWVLSETGQIG